MNCSNAELKMREGIGGGAIVTQPRRGKKAGSQEEDEDFVDGHPILALSQVRHGKSPRLVRPRRRRPVTSPPTALPLATYIPPLIVRGTDTSRHATPKTLSSASAPESPQTAASRTFVPPAQASTPTWPHLTCPTPKPSSPCSTFVKTPNRFTPLRRVCTPGLIARR